MPKWDYDMVSYSRELFDLYWEWKYEGLRLSKKNRTVLNKDYDDIRNYLNDCLD